MRAKFIFATLVVVLFCSLATLEITELFELTDDTSNDFSLVGTQQASSAVVPQGLELQPKTDPTTETRWPTARPVRASASYHAKDVLHLLCLMRTRPFRLRNCDSFSLTNNATGNLFTGYG